MDFEEAYLAIVKASLEKDTIEVPTILSCLDFKDKNCLEIGCGPLARLAIKFSDVVKHVTCLENYDKIIEKARKKIDEAELNDKISIQMYKKDDPYRLPFEDNSFDVVYGAWLPHNLVTNFEFLDEIVRVSKNDVLLIMSGIDDDLVKMKSIVFPGEKERREAYKEKIEGYLKEKGLGVEFKGADLRLDFEDLEEAKGVFYCFDFKNEDLGDKKKEVDNFLSERVHNMRNSFYCLHGEK